MTTSDRTPVEQLIGWEWDDGSRNMRRGWWVHSDDGWVYKGRAEVDDLAGWLDDNGYDARPPYDQSITERPCWLEVSATHFVDPPRPGWWREVEGPTIRDAFVAAVRAVSDG